MDKCEMKAAIKKGVKFLNEVNPEWYKKIDLETLDLSSQSNCVLGKLYRNFFDGQSTLGLNNVKTFAMGFDIEEDSALEYRKLTKGWKKAINKKRNEYFFPKII